MTFKEAVEATPDVARGYRPGLTALGTYSSKVSVSDKSKLGGSVDIDANTAKLYPNDNRWDYVFDYKSKVFLWRCILLIRVK